MTQNRYYQKNYEESYYIFDSKTLTEKEFEEKVEYDGYTVFEDSLTPTEVLDLLNENEELKERVKQLQIEKIVIRKRYEALISENEELKNKIYKLHYKPPTWFTKTHILEEYQR